MKSRSPLLALLGGAINPMTQRNILYVLILLWGGLSLSAQMKRFPLRDYFSSLSLDKEEMRHRYFYDKEGDLDPYVGRWVGDDGHGTQMRLQIYKIKDYQDIETHMDILALDMKLSRPGISLPHPDTELIDGKELIPGFMFFKFLDNPPDLHAYLVFLNYNFYSKANHSHSSQEYFGYIELSLDLIEEGTILQVHRRAVVVIGHRRYHFPDYLTREQKDHILWKLHREKE